MIKKFDRSFTIQIVSNIAVLAGVVFLAIEIQQSNRIARGSIEVEIQRGFESHNVSVYTDLALAELLVKCKEVNPKLTEAEKEPVSNVGPA